MLFILFNMKTVNSRELAHRTKEIRHALEQGERLAWKSRGETIAVLEPVRRTPAAKEANHWMRRAVQAGGVSPKGALLSQMVYDDR